MAKKVILFDVDGTVADLRHRLHHVKGRHKDWKAFNAGIPNDLPIKQTLFLNNLLHHTLSPSMDIIFASGRSEDERIVTEEWFEKHGVKYKKLYMRKSGDYRPDYVIKLELLAEMRVDGYEPYIVIDDRQSVVDAWRKAGLFVLQCDPHLGECNSDHYHFHKDIVFPLTILVGPSGSGKSSWCNGYLSNPNNSFNSVISSDEIRQDICGNFKDQTQNERVFRTMHELAESRLKLGLPVVLDATHIRNADRIKATKLIPDAFPVEYVVINRPLKDKIDTGGWRNSVLIKGKSLIHYHDEVFNNNLKDILAGDGLPNVTVSDLRK